MIRVEPHIEIKDAEFIYKDLGLCIEHNYLCAVCREKSAVLFMNTGVLHPCWGCQKDYALVRKSWFRKFLEKRGRRQ